MKNNIAGLIVTTDIPVLAANLEKKAKSWMFQNFRQYVKRGDLNITRMAEDAYDKFVGDEMDIPDDWFEWALDVQDKLIEQGHKLLI